MISFPESSMFAFKNKSIISKGTLLFWSHNLKDYFENWNFHANLCVVKVAVVRVTHQTGHGFHHQVSLVSDNTAGATSWSVETGSLALGHFLLHDGVNPVRINFGYLKLSWMLFNKEWGYLIFLHLLFKMSYFVLAVKNCG